MDPGRSSSARGGRGASRSRLRCVMSRPPNVIRPLVGSSRRIRQRAIVDLPHPDSPTTPSVSPCLTVKLIPSTALTLATSFWKTIPRVTGKCFTRSSTTRRSFAASAVQRGAHHTTSASVPFEQLRDLTCPLPSSSRWQACRCCGSFETGSSAGSTDLQSASTYGQRGWKRQPCGGFSSDGGWPWIWTRRSTSDVDPHSDPSRPQGVRVVGAREDLVDRPLLRDAARVHHDHVVGDLSDDAEVVGDHHDRECRTRPEASPSALGSAPASSRRAPWSARRRSADRAR